METSPDQANPPEGGIITFDRVEHAFRAEKFLTQAGIAARVEIPPSELDTGCNLGVVFNLGNKLEVERVLKEKKAEYIYIGAPGECRIL